jgi:Spy/CpxP family protein refolding chaperone
VKMRSWLIALLLLIPAGARAQGPEGPPPQGDPRRQQLQRQIVQRFMEHVTNELNLDAATRRKLEEQLRDSGEDRREIARATNDLRRRIMDASRDSTTSDAEFRKLLTEMTTLRQKEEDRWKADQDALGKILTPRQQARFVFMWLRFNEQIREMALRPPPGRAGFPRDCSRGARARSREQTRSRIAGEACGRGTRSRNPRRTPRPDRIPRSRYRPPESVSFHSCRFVFSSSLNTEPRPALAR